MRISERFRSLPKRQIILLIAIICTFASIIILVVNPAARKGPLGFGPPAPMVTFQMSDDSFSISYPENWTVFETPQGNHGDHEVVAIILVAGHQIANVTVARQSISAGNINDVVNWGQARAAIHEGYKSSSVDPFTVNNLGGYIHEYSWSHASLFENSILSSCQDVYALKNNIGYSVSFCSSEKDWRSLEGTYTEMQQSFYVK